MQDGGSVEIRRSPGTELSRDEEQRRRRWLASINRSCKKRMRARQEPGLEREPRGLRPQPDSGYIPPTMPKRRLFHLPLFCLLLLSLVTSGARVSGHVWCLSTDGHATLETALADDCSMDGDAARPSATPHVALEAGDEDCDHYLDISSSFEWGSPRVRDLTSQLDLPALPAIAPAPLVASPADPALTAGHTPQVPPRLSEQIRHHRTIVLLI